MKQSLWILPFFVLFCLSAFAMDPPTMMAQNDPVPESPEAPESPESPESKGEFVPPQREAIQQEPTIHPDSSILPAARLAELLEFRRRNGSREFQEWLPRQRDAYGLNPAQVSALKRFFRTKLQDKKKFRHYINVSETLNDMGETFDLRSDIHTRFFSQGNGKLVLDVGCAYGVNTLRALSAGMRVIANDLDPSHLLHLVNTVRSKHPEWLDRLFVHAGRFPEELILVKGSLQGIIFTNVASFFILPSECDRAFKSMSQSLAPGGKLLFIATSPYHMIESIAPYLRYPYKKMALKIEETRTSSSRYPTLFVSFVLDRIDSAPQLQGRILSALDATPRRFHNFSRYPTSRILEELGFLVDQSGYYNMHTDNEYNYHLRGTVNGDYLGILATRMSEAELQN